MPIRFSTVAANADILGDDTVQHSSPESMPPADGTARDRTKRPRSQPSPAAESRGSEAKPGKDINAAGFLKDKDASKP